MSETDYEAKAESGAVCCSGKSSSLIDKLPARVNERYRKYLESSSPDERYMARALQLAWRGCGWVNPNPMVGAVIVKDGRIIGEGWHTKFGALHAEREAFARCKENPQGATLYVTLEPCCHWGKTSPCTQAIIENKIKRVVVGAPDPNPLVAGKGAAQLREAGIEVTEKVLLQECQSINKVFLHYIQTNRPYVIAKYAMTLDGKIATKTGASKWITGPEAREQVHLHRHRFSSIMVGVGTVLADNPSLTCRIGQVNSSRNPVRVIVDSRLRTPLDATVVQTAQNVPTIIATACDDDQLIDQYRMCGCTILHVAEKEGRVDLEELLQLLGAKGIDSVYVEGGATLHASLIEARLVNEIHAYIAPKIFGGAQAPGPIGGEGIALPEDALRFSNVVASQLGEDLFIECEVN